MKDLDSRALILAFFAFFVDFLRNVVRKVVITSFLTHKWGLLALNQAKETQPF